MWLEEIKGRVFIRDKGLTHFVWGRAGRQGISWGSQVTCAAALGLHPASFIRLHLFLSTAPEPMHVTKQPVHSKQHLIPLYLEIRPLTRPTQLSANHKVHVYTRAQRGIPQSPERVATSRVLRRSRFSWEADDRPDSHIDEFNVHSAA